MLKRKFILGRNHMNSTYSGAFICSCPRRSEWNQS